MGIVGRSGNRLSRADPKRAHERTGMRDETEAPAPARNLLCSLGNDISTAGAAHGEGRATPSLRSTRIAVAMPGSRQVNEVYAVASRRMAMPAAAIKRLACTIVNVP